MSKEINRKSDAGALQADVAKHLDISQSRVAQFVGDGIFIKEPSGRLGLAACRIAYIRWLRDETRKSSTSASASRVQDARAEEIKLRIEEKRGTLLAAGQAEAVSVIDTFFGGLRADLLAIPARIALDLSTRRKIEDAMFEAFGAAGKRAAAAADRVETAQATINAAIHRKPKTNKRARR